VGKLLLLTISLAQHKNSVMVYSLTPLTMTYDSSLPLKTAVTAVLLPTKATVNTMLSSKNQNRAGNVCRKNSTTRQ